MLDKSETDEVGEKGEVLVGSLGGIHDYIRDKAVKKYHSGLKSLRLNDEMLQEAKKSMCIGRPILRTLVGVSLCLLNGSPHFRAISSIMSAKKIMIKLRKFMLELLTVDETL